ncbi:MAG: CPBP family intramembrane metalloprotease [Oscillospiraceae bacterium]|nr:CPBP family intramembrane metalloprotease [Oscillospiraceae bacterium]
MSQAISSLVFVVLSQGYIAEILYAVFRIVLLYVLLSWYCKKILHITLGDCRVSKPNTLWVWVLCAIALPLCVSGFFILFTQGTFQVSSMETGQVLGQLVTAIFGVCLAAGITEELVFRGVIMRILEARWGKLVAIVAPSMVFGLLHIGNMQTPNIADILILLLAGTSVGVMFSVITYQSNSIWPSTIVHGIWNLIIIGGILNIGVTHEGVNLFTYTLRSESVWLTGGSFGIEASVPAIVGYWLVIFLACSMNKRKTPHSGGASKRMKSRTV